MTTDPPPGDARLRRLVAANQEIVADLDLGAVLRRIVEAAVDLVDARYGALGVIAPGGRGLEQFVHVGVAPDVVERVGHLPQARGVLGALIDDPRPIRLHHLADDPRSVGFPAGHPPMDSFLGVPIRVRGEVYGNLYLTDARSRQFDELDEAVAVSLAATAGIAIHNARLYTDSGRRQEWLLASSDLTRRVLGDPSTVTPQLVADAVATLADSPLVVVVEDRAPDGGGQHDDGPDEVVVTAARGAGADGLIGAVVIPTGPLRRTAGTGDARSVEALDALPPDVLPPGAPVTGGPALLLPLLGPRRTVLVAARPPGAHPFTGPELEMASTFAAQVSVAFELARARADPQRMTLLEDRARIARDLHDHVIQQLFAAGLTVQGVATTLDDPERAAALAGVVDALDEAVKRVRTSIFHLRTGSEGTSLRAHVLDVVAELRDGLGFEPHVVFAGPVDTMGSDVLAEDVLAVVREGLTNVTRHAAAGSASVRLHAGPAQLTVEVEDDGCGLAVRNRHSGLANLRERARRHGGDVEIGPGADGVGTRLRWSVPTA